MSGRRGDLDADILAYLAEDLDPARQDDLDRRLREDALVAVRFAELCRHEVALAAVFQRPQAASRPVRRRRAQARRGGWWWMAAAAAVLLVAITIGLVVKSAPPTVGQPPVLATLSEVSGASTVDATAAAPGMTLRAGARLAVGSGRLVFNYPDGSRLELAANSEATLAEDPGKQVVLERGGLQAVVAAQPAGRPLRVRTPQGEAEVIGTSFRLVVANLATRLEVAEGRVRLSRMADGTTCLVQAGFACTSSAGRPLALEWTVSVAESLPPGATIAWRAELAEWEGELAAPTGYAGLRALGSHAQQLGTRFIGEVRSPSIHAGLIAGPDRYLAIRCLAAGFRPDDRIKLMLKDGAGAIYHGEIRVASDVWSLLTLRLDGAFKDLEHAARPMPPGSPIERIVLLAAAPDGQEAVSGPRLWIAEVVAFTSSRPVAALQVMAP